LELEGIGALTAANGDEGIALYQAHASEIELVLLDLSMPGKSGRDTFAALQEFDPDVNIMLSSGYSEADATQGLASPPLVGFLQKPYRLDTFVQRLQKFL
jgi:CheY-like chemotaxis protein